MSALALVDGWLKVTVLFSPILKLFHSMIALFEFWTTVILVSVDDIAISPLNEVGLLGSSLVYEKFVKRRIEIKIKKNFIIQFLTKAFFILK